MSYAPFINLMRADISPAVIPAQAGIQILPKNLKRVWMPDQVGHDNTLFINLVRADIQVSNGMIIIKRKKYPILTINRVRPIIFELTMEFMGSQ